MFIYRNGILILMKDEIQNLDFITKIISNFRVSIPIALRELLELEEGDIVELEIKRIVKKQEAVASV